MVANCAAPALQITIGGQDWSACSDGFDAGVPERDDSGLLPITGSLRLAPVNPPQSMNPRANRQFWRRGLPIRVAVWESGAWVPHPYGWLYLLQPPPLPRQGESLELEVGCALALLNAEQPGEESGLEIGTATLRHEVINALLAAAGCPALVDPIPGWPLTFPLSRDGSYISQAGAIAYAAGHCLWQDNAGQIRALPLPLGGVGVDHALQIGRDEELYEGYGNPESPVELYRCAAVLPQLKSNYESRTDFLEDYGEASAIDPNFSGWQALRTTLATSSTSAQGQLNREEIYEVGATVYPITRPKDLGLTWRSTGESRQQFAGNLLITEETITTCPLEAIAAEWVEGLPEAQRAIGRQTATTIDRTEYSYDAAQRVQKITVSKQLPTAAIVGSQAPWGTAKALDLFTSEKSVTEWIRLAQGYRVRETRSRALVSQRQQGTPPGQVDTITTLQLRAISNRISSASAAQNQPPATQHRPAPYSVEELPLEGVAQFSLGGGVERDRPPQEVRYVAAAEQLEAIAQWEGEILIGRAQGQIIQSGWRRLLPLQGVEAAELDGTKVLYQADAVRYSHTADEAIVGCAGIWLGTTPAGSVIRQPPYDPVVPGRGGLRQGGSAGFWPYALEIGQLEGARGGQRQGGGWAVVVGAAIGVGASALGAGTSVLGVQG